MIRRPIILLALLVAALLALGAPAAATAAVSITEIDRSRFPTVRVAFGADSDGGQAPDLTFRENGEPLAGVSLYRGTIGSYEDAKRTDVMLVFDTSFSMGIGTRFDDAVAAANAMIEHARPTDQVGLATFGGAAQVVLEPTADHAAVKAALSRLELSNRTTMFDGVSKAARAFDRKARANRAIVLLSDGTDVGSVQTADEAAGEALKARAPVFAVAIREDATEQPRDLADLGNGTGGELQTIAGTAGLERIFDDLGRRLLQPYWVEYQSNAAPRSTVSFAVAIAGSKREVARQTFRAIPSSTVAAAGGAPQPAKGEPKPLLPMPDGMLGVLLASLPFALLVFLGSWRFLDKRSAPDVVGRIERYTARATAVTAHRPEQRRPSLARRLGTPIATLGESLLGRSQFFDRTRARAEQAAIAIKPSELFAAMVAGAGLGFFVGLMVGNLLVMFLLTLVFGFIPNAWLRLKARKRRNAFDDQLADVLQGISSSLKAGHSFNQAINAMVKDAPNPTSEEFSRVMTEARLGMPIEAALQHMADRMGSSDFEFAVTTVNIQRSVGGSLADILEMVGDTVRNRQQFRKKVKALTSMGQMSAYVLIAMPIFMGLVITVMSPSYMAPMFNTTIGHFMMAAGATSITLGYFACMKVVSVKI